jgi:hypothetical protein
LQLKSVIRGLKKCPGLVEKEKFKRGWTPYNANPAWVASKPNGKAFHRRDEAEVRAARDNKKKKRKEAGGKHEAIMQCTHYLKVR